MRPQIINYTPVTTSVSGFANNVTGGTWTLTTTATTDGLAHTVTIHNDAATDHSAKTALLTGTDADGVAITETMNLPAGTLTTNSTKKFKTLTSIVPSASIGADTMDIGWLVAAVGPSIPCDRISDTYNTIAVDITGTINFTIEETFEPFNTANPSTDQFWIAIAGLTGKTADTVSSNTLNASGFRFALTSVTNGATVKIIANQATRSA